MILSKDTTTGKGSKAKTTLGERTKANAEFNKDTVIPAALRTKLARATVLIKTNDNRGIGSGVILNADATDGSTDAYVLTAKHLLYILSGEDPTKKKPADCVTQSFLSNLSVFYNTAALGGVPPTGVAVADIDFTGSSNQTWDYDIMVLKVSDATFRTYVANNRFVPANGNDTYRPLLKAQNNGSCNILDKASYVYLQMGYGAGRDKDVKATSGYEDLSGKLQCRWPTIDGKAPLGSAFEVDNKKGVVKSSNTNLIMTLADDTNSTGEGDSGGPLFAIPLKLNERTTMYLVGVTTGANLFSKPEYKDNPKTAPGDDHLHNNVSTYWDTVCYAWDWT